MANNYSNEEENSAKESMDIVLSPFKEVGKSVKNGVKDAIKESIKEAKKTAEEGKTEKSSDTSSASSDMSNSSKPTDYTSREEKIASVDDLRIDDLGAMSQPTQEWDFFEYENLVYSDQMAATRFLAERDHFLQTGEVRDSHLYDPNTDGTLENVGNGKFVDASSYNKTLDANIKANPNVELEKIEEATKKSCQNENVPGIKSKWAEGQEPVANFGEKIDIDEVRRTRDELKEFKAIRQEMEGPSLGGVGVSNAPVSEDLSMAVEEDALNQGIEEELELGKEGNPYETFGEKESSKEDLLEEGDVRELSRENEEDHIQVKSSKEESTSVVKESAMNIEKVATETSRVATEGASNFGQTMGVVGTSSMGASFVAETETLDSVSNDFEMEMERTKDSSSYVADAFKISQDKDAPKNLDESSRDTNASRNEEELLEREKTRTSKDKNPYENLQSKSKEQDTSSKPIEQSSSYEEEISDVSLDESKKQYEDVSFEKTSGQGMDSVELNENSTPINYAQNSYTQTVESSVGAESFKGELDVELEKTRQQDGNTYETLKQQEQPNQEESIDDVSLDERKDAKSKDMKEQKGSDVTKEKSTQSFDSVNTDKSYQATNYQQQYASTSSEMEATSDTDKEAELGMERTKDEQSAYDKLESERKEKEADAKAKAETEANETSKGREDAKEKEDAKSRDGKEDKSKSSMQSQKGVDSVNTDKTYVAANYNSQQSYASEMTVEENATAEQDLGMERERSASEEDAYKKLEEEKAAKQSAEDAKKAEEQATTDAKSRESSKEKEDAKRRDVDTKSANKNGQNLNTSKMYDASNYQKNAAAAQSAAIAAGKVEQDAAMEMERTRSEQASRNEASEIRRKNEEQAKQVAEEEKSVTAAKERDAAKKKQDAKSRQGLNKNDSRVDMKQVTKTTSTSKTVTKTKTETIDILKVKNNNTNEKTSSATANMIKKAEANKAASRQFGGALGSMGTVAGGISSGAQSVGNVLTSENQAEAIAEEFKNKATKQLTKVVKRTTKKVVKKGGEKLRKEAQRRAAEKVAKKTAEKTVKTATKAATKAAATGVKAGAGAAAGAATAGVGTVVVAALEAKNKVKDTFKNIISNVGKSDDKEKMGFGGKLGMKIAIAIGVAVAPILLIIMLISTVVSGGGAIGGVLIAKFGSDVVSILDGSWTFIGQRYQALSEFNYAQMIADDVCEVLGETFVESAKNDAQNHFVSGDYKIPSPQIDASGHKLYDWYADVSEGEIGYVWMREQCDKFTRTDGSIAGDLSGTKLFTEMGYLHTETNEPYYYLADKESRLSITPNANIVPIMSMAHDRYDDSWTFDNFKVVEAYVYYMYALSHNSAHYESQNPDDTYSYTFEDSHIDTDLFDLTQWSWDGSIDSSQGWHKETSTLTRPLPFSLVTGASSTDIANGTYQYSECSNIYIHGYNKDDFFGASDNTKAMIDKAKEKGKKILSFLDGLIGTDLASFIQQAGVYQIHMYEKDGSIVYKNLTTGEDNITSTSKLISSVVDGYTQYCQNYGIDSWSKSGTICGQDSNPSHTHSASCWNTQCGKDYHIHTTSCFSRTCSESSDSCQCGGGHTSSTECPNWGGGHSHGAGLSSLSNSQAKSDSGFDANGCHWELNSSCSYHEHTGYTNPYTLGCYDLVVYCKGHCGGHIKPTINLAVTYTFEGLAYQDAVTINKDKAPFIFTDDFEKDRFKTQKTVANWSKKVTNQVNKYFDPFPNGPLSALCWAGEGIETGLLHIYELWYGLWHDGDDSLGAYDVTADSSKTSRVTGQDTQGFQGWFLQEAGNAPKLDLGRIGELYDLYGTPEDFYAQGVDLWKNFEVTFQIGYGETLTPAEIQDIVNAIKTEYPDLSSARESVIRDALEHVGMYVYQCDSNGHFNGMYADAGPSECTGFATGVYMRALGSKCGFWNDVSSSFTSDTGESGTISGKGSGGIHRDYGAGYGGRSGNGTGTYQIPSVYYISGKRPLGKFYGSNVASNRKPGDIVSRDPVDGKGSGHSMVYLGHFTDPLSDVEGDYVVDCSSDTGGSAYRMYTKSNPNKINDYRAVYSPFSYFGID